MLDISSRAQAIGYDPREFRRMIADLGGLETAKRLLQDRRPSDGFTTLMLKGRPDLTLETLVLEPQWQSLFTDAELGVASTWLGRR